MRRLIPVVLGLSGILSLSVSAFAGTVNVDFTFDTQTINGKTVTGLSANATYGQIQTYMNQVLSASGCTGCSVSVYAPLNGTSGAVADTTYTADGNVVGTVSGSTVTPLTLGNTSGATNNQGYTSTSSTNNAALNSGDTFIANTSNSGGTANGNGSGTTSQITLQFSGFTAANNASSLTISSFNYEVFPDISCQSITTGANCGTKGASTPSGYSDQPSLAFEAGQGTTGSDALQDTYWGITPGSNQTEETGSTLSNVLQTGDGSSTHSTNSGSGSSSLDPQAIGTWNGTITSSTGYEELDFVDWPATIGIDNLQISYTTASPVPEPAGIALFGTLVFLLSRKLRKTA